MVRIGSESNARDTRSRRLNVDRKEATSADVFVNEPLDVVEGGFNPDFSLGSADLGIGGLPSCFH